MANAGLNYSFIAEWGTYIKIKESAECSTNSHHVRKLFKLNKSAFSIRLYRQYWGVSGASVTASLCPTRVGLLEREPILLVANDWWLLIDTTFQLVYIKRYRQVNSEKSNIFLITALEPFRNNQGYWNELYLLHNPCSTQKHAGKRDVIRRSEYRLIQSVVFNWYVRMHSVRLTIRYTTWITKAIINSRWDVTICYMFQRHKHRLVMSDLSNHWRPDQNISFNF